MEELGTMSKNNLAGGGSTTGTMVRGVSSVMVFARNISMSSALRVVLENRISPTFYMLVQNVSVSIT